MSPLSSGKKLFALGVATVLAAALLPSTPAEAADDPCTTADVTYAVNGSLMIKDTQFGAADGVYPLGAGKAKVRFEKGPGGGTARLMGYELDNSFTVKASFAVWSTTVVTQSRTTVASSCEGASSGVVDNGNVVWQTPATGYRSDGTIDCAGNVCGKFGAPAPGSTPLHETASVKFQPFHFAADGKTFSMPYTQVSHSNSPKQTAYLALSGRETGRSCVTVQATCQ